MTSHTTSATTATSDQEATAPCQPSSAANGAVSDVAKTDPRFIVDEYRPVASAVLVGKSRAMMTGTTTLPTVIAQPSTTVPVKAAATPAVPEPAERISVPRSRPPGPP